MRGFLFRELKWKYTVVTLSKMNFSIHSMISFSKENLINNRIKDKKPCDILQIIEIGNSKSVLLIQDMFPITEKYIERPYTINGVPLIIKSEKYIKVLNRKAQNIYRLIHRGVKLNPTQPDVMSIKSRLLNEIEHTEPIGSIP